MRSSLLPRVRHHYRKAFKIVDDGREHFVYDHSLREGRDPVREQGELGSGRNSLWRPCTQLEAKSASEPGQGVKASAVADDVTGSLGLCGTPAIRSGAPQGPKLAD